MLCFLLLLFSVYIPLFLTHWALASSGWIENTHSGFATMTHYTMAPGYIASCGCTGTSTDYPTAALSQMAYGSSVNYGPACGRCFKLTLLNPIIATPPFHPNVEKSVVVKVTDLCPLSSAGWCSGTKSKPNSAGAYLNFDLVYPSNAVPDDFFPSNVTLYGYKDFGVWNISYQSVSCMSNWGGARNAAALGSVKSLGTSACCPAEPQPGNMSASCPSYSDRNGIPYAFQNLDQGPFSSAYDRPDTRTSRGVMLTLPPYLRPAGAIMLIYLLFI